MNELTTKPTKQTKRLARRILKRAFLGVVLGLAASGVIFALRPQPVSVEVAKAGRGELVVTVDEDGRARVKDRYVVSVPLAGNLARIELRAGDYVKQGQVVARIVPSQAPLMDARSRSQAEAEVAAAQAGLKQSEAQVERATAALEFADAEAGRFRSLLRGQVVSQQEVERMELEQRSRKAELTSASFGEKVALHKLAMARAALGHYRARSDEEVLTVTSPISGRVLKLIQQSEGVVQAGTPLLEVGNPEALEIVVDVLTSDAVKILPGSSAIVEEWGGEALDAIVRVVEPSAFTRLSALGVEEQRVNAVVDLIGPYDKWSKLGDGYRVEARIETFRAEGVLLAPESALFRHQGKWAAYVVKNGIATLRIVTVGRRSDTLAMIEFGLEEGEILVLHPSDKVVDGVKLLLR
jgi:HlyD family secretion protein